MVLKKKRVNTTMMKKMMELPLKVSTVVELELERIAIQARALLGEQRDSKMDALFKKIYDS
jgi:hypothetical protein